LDYLFLVFLLFHLLLFFSSPDVLFCAKGRTKKRKDVGVRADLRDRDGPSRKNNKENEEHAKKKKEAEKMTIAEA